MRNSVTKLIDHLAG